MRKKIISIILVLCFLTTIYTISYSTSETLFIPENLITQVIDSNSIQVTWDSVENADYYELDADASIITTSALTYTHTALEPESSHTYKVKAVNETQSSDWSAGVNATTLSVLSVPANINTTATQTAITVTWDSVNNADYYEIEADSSITTTSALTYTHMGLESGTTHIYRLRAVDGTENSEWSAEISETTTALIIAPANISTTATQTAITVTWDSVNNADYYELEADGNIITTSALTYTHIGLQPETTHTYRVRAVNSLQSSEWSLSINQTTSTSIEEPNLQKVSCVFEGHSVETRITTNNIDDNTSGSVVLTVNHGGDFTFDDAGNIIEASAVEGYYFFENEDGTGSVVYVYTEFIVDNPISNVGYCFTGYSIDMEGDDSFSIIDYSVAPANGNTPDYYINHDITNNAVIIWTKCFVNSSNKQAAPISNFIITANFEEINIQIPQNLTAQAIESECISISWDSVENSDFYELEADGVVITTSALTYTHTELESETSHTYKVRAVDAYGNKSEYSEEVTVVTLIEEQIKIFAGQSTSFIIDEADKLKTLGTNIYGIGGLGYSSNQNIPLNINGLTGVKEIVSGSSYVAAIMEDGTVKAWGLNKNGQLGIGNKDNKDIPVDVPNLENVKQLSMGYFDTLALMEDGTVKAWGWNNYGQLGIGNKNSKDTPVDIPNLTDVKQLTMGVYHSLALMNDGTVKAWGRNNYGQLGIGSTTTQTNPVDIPNLTGVKKIVAGDFHIVALMQNGTVKVWGRNEYGQLGIGNTTNKTTPVDIPNLTGVKDIAAGEYHTIILMEDGTIKAWGRNNNGQLGIGNTSNQSIPIDVLTLSNVKNIFSGGEHTIALMENGTFKAWGYNSLGQLGIGNETNQTSPVNIPNLNAVKQIAIGNGSTVALMEDGTVKAWGSNCLGELGIGRSFNKKPVEVSLSQKVKKISIDSNHIIALMEDGTVKAWGYNNYGQLGIGNTNNQNIPVGIEGLSNVKNIEAGNNHTFALMKNGTVKAWGYNNYGQLGIGNTTMQNTPVDVSSITGVKQLTAGSSHTIALMEDGTVKAWGYNNYGQLGIGNTTNQNAPVNIPNLSGVKKIVTGLNYTIALMEDGTVKAWGENTLGQLGIGNSTNQTTPIEVSALAEVKDIATGDFHTIVLMEDGTVKTWGVNWFGQLGIGNKTSKIVPFEIPGLIGVKNIAAGMFHTIAFMDDDKIKAWGYNGYGQLGTGDTLDRYIPLQIDFNYSDIESPTSPQNLTYITKTDRSITIDWNASTDTAGIASYEIYKGEEYVGKTTQTNLLITGLSASTTYNVKVRAIDVNGNKSEFSEAVNVTTLDELAIPTNINSSSKHDEITISWDEVNNAEYYELEIDSTTTVTTSALTYTHTGLEPETTYTY